MEEIDFLPQWYKAGRQRHIGYRTQYIVIIVILMMMVLWSASTDYSIRSARAQLDRARRMQVASSIPLYKYNKLKNNLQQLSRKAQILEEVDSEIIVSNILAELAFLIDKRIVLSKLDIKAEAFEPENKNGYVSGSVVTVVNADADKEKLPLEGDIRFRVLMTGLAVNAADVARLIRTLEESLYVCEVKPMFCRNKKLKDYQAAEFQVSCYIANYREEN